MNNKAGSKSERQNWRRERGFDGERRQEIQCSLDRSRIAGDAPERAAAGRFGMAGQAFTVV